jgi:hypothetical protein
VIEAVKIPFPVEEKGYKSMINLPVWKNTVDYMVKLNKTGNIMYFRDNAACIQGC